MKKNYKKILAGIMSCMLIIANVSPVMAEDDTSIVQDITTDDSHEITIDLDELNSTEVIKEITSEEIKDVSTEEVTDFSEEDTEEISEEEIKEDISTEEVTSEEVITEEENTEVITEEIVNETVSTEEEVTEFITFDHYFSNIDTSLVNTSDLMIQTNDSSIFTKNTNVISNYDDVYIISCDSVEEARYVYSYYVDKVSFISDMSNVFSLTDEETEDIADLSDVNTDSEDAIAQLNEISTKSYEGYIALIDTGSDATNRLSVFDDNGFDENGHGTSMYNYIKEEAPDAKILSIKAFDGKSSNVANIYAAIRLAIDSNVSIINLSFSGLDIESNVIIKDIINEALDKGITVIGAAGNAGSNAKYYIPGCIDKAIIAGACDSTGTRLSISNYGSTVDYYIDSDSTSEAAARLSGIIYSNKELISANRVFILDIDDDGVQTFIDEDSNFYTENTTYAIVYDGHTYEVPEWLPFNVELTGECSKTNYRGDIKFPKAYINNAETNINDPDSPCNGNYIECGSFFNIGTVSLNSKWGSYDTNFNQYKNLELVTNNATISKAGNSYSGDGLGYSAWCCNAHKVFNKGTGTFYTGLVKPANATITTYGTNGKKITLANSDVKSSNTIADYVVKDGYLYVPYIKTMHRFTSSQAQSLGFLAYVKIKLTKEVPYFFALEKTTQGKYLANNVTFDISVAKASKGTADEVASITNWTNRKFSNTYAYTGLWTGWYYNFATSKSNNSTDKSVYKDIRKYTSGSSTARTEAISFTADKTYSINPQDGIALTYLGKYPEGTKLYVKITENWPNENDAQAIEGNKSVKINSEDYVKDLKTYTFLIDDSYNSPEAAIDYAKSTNNTYFWIKNGQTTYSKTNSGSAIWNNKKNNTYNVDVVKVTAPGYENYVKDNPNYSLNGTTYDLFKLVNNKETYIHTYKFDSNGATKEFDITDYMNQNSAGEILNTTFRLRETKAGKGYALDDSNIDFVVTKNDKSITKTVEDMPEGDPFTIILQKHNSYTGTNITTMDDVKMSFKATYYPATIPTDINKCLRYSSLSKLTTGISHTYEATIEQFNKKTITIDEEDFNSTWTEGFPYGYLVIEEFSAPEGYLKSKDYILTIGSDTINLNSKPVFILAEVGQYYINNNNQVKALSVQSITVTNSDGYDGKLQTAITDNNTNSQIGNALLDTQTINDKVWYWGIPEGEKITISGELIDLDKYLEDGTKVVVATASQEVTVDSYSKTKDTTQVVDLVYTFNKSKNPEGHRLTAVTKIAASNGATIVEDNSAWLTCPMDEIEDTIVKSETIYYPSGKTTAHSAATGIKSMGKRSSTRIMDWFNINNLVVGKDYTIIAKVMERTDKGTGVPFKSDGKEVVNKINLSVSANGVVTATDVTDPTNPINLTCDFTVDQYNTQLVKGKVKLEIFVNAEDVEDKTTTVFENLYMGDEETGKLLIAHDDIDDAAQQVHFMKIETDLVDSSYALGDEDSVGVKKVDDKLTDRITLTKIAAPYDGDGINKDTVITIEGVLKDKSTGEDYQYEDGSKITADGVLTITKTGVSATGDIDANNIKLTLDADTHTYSGTIDLVYTFDSSKFEKLTLVSFVRATVTNDSNEVVPIAIHDDINDLREAVNYTRLGTQFNDRTTDVDVPVTGLTTTYDRVLVENLVYGKTYTVTGAIQRKDMEGNHLGALQDENGNDVVVSAVVTVDDEGNVTAPEAENLQFTKDDDNKTVSGTLDLYFSIDTTKLQGEDIVAFETLSHKGIVIDFHTNIKDENQTIHVPKGGTTAIDKDTQDKVATVKEDADTTISDKVSLENLSNGHTYYVYGKLMDKETNSELLVNGNIVTSKCIFKVNDDGEVEIIEGSNEYEFTKNENDTVSGYITLDFTFSTKDCANKDVVVFEYGYYVKDVNKINELTDDDIIFVEDDITNKDQSVHFTDIKTLATDDTYKGHIGLVNEISTLTEKSMLYNLSYGQTYDVTATLVDKYTGEDILQDGQKIQRTATITISDDGQTVTAVDKADNTIEFVVGDIVTDDDNDTLDMFVEIPMTFDSTVVAGKTTVVYEDLEHKDVTVRVHREQEDIDEQIHYYKLTILKTGLKDAINAKFTATHNNEVVYFNKIEDGLYYVAPEATDTTVTIVNPNKDGVLVINGFNEGKYVFTEVQTENGLNLMSSTFTAEFTPTSFENGLLYEFKLITKDKTTVIEKDSEETPNAVTVGIKNNEVVTLHTGGSGIGGFLMMSILLIMLAASLLIYKKKKMHLFKYFVLFAISAIVILPTATKAYAEEPTNTVVDDDNDDADVDIYNVKGDKAPIIDETQKCKLVVNYYDDLDATKPIARATFAIYKVADIDTYGGYTSLVKGIDFSKAPGNEEQYCSDAYIATIEQNIKPEAVIFTDANGHFDQELPMGLYVVREIKPAEHHINSKPFLVQLPTIAADADGNYLVNNKGEMYWEYEITAMPKSNPAGDISVKKLVKGNAGEETRDFTFKFEWDAKGEFEYHKYKVGSNEELDHGENELLASGESVTLKHNERVVVKNLPAGTKYKVTETEANKDGYVTGYVNETGSIVRFEEIDCTVTNERNTNKTGDVFSPTLMYSLIGLAILSLAVMIIVIRKKKTTNTEE